MALTKCKECGKEVSTKAKECPSCGAPVKSSSSVGCLTIIAIIFVIGMIGSLFDNDKSYKSTKTQTSAPKSDLEKYGHSVATSTGGEIKLVSVKQTTKSPLNAFIIIFKTDHEDLMSNPGAKPGNSAYYENQGRTMVWSAKFCTNKLKRIMLQHKIDLVTGELTNLVGEIQSASPCFSK